MDMKARIKKLQEGESALFTIVAKEHMCPICPNMKVCASPKAIKWQIVLAGIQALAAERHAIYETTGEQPPIGSPKLDTEQDFEADTSNDGRWN